MHLSPVKQEPQDADPRVRQVVIGSLAILAVGLLAILLWLGRAHPGFLGEWSGILAGVFSTPFLMEGGLILIGLMIVLGLNAWRQRREGDDYVTLELEDDAAPKSGDGGQ